MVITSRTGISQTAKKQPDAKPSKESVVYPPMSTRIDPCNNIFQTTVEEGHVKETLGLGQGIQRIQTFSERRQLSQDSMTHIRGLEPPQPPLQHRIGQSIPEGSLY
jgi:hypothetical protein